VFEARAIVTTTFDTLIILDPKKMIAANVVLWKSKPIDLFSSLGNCHHRVLAHVNCFEANSLFLSMHRASTFLIVCQFFQAILDN